MATLRTVTTALASLAIASSLAACSGDGSDRAEDETVSDTVRMPSHLLSAVPTSTDFARILGEDVTISNTDTHVNARESGYTSKIETEACAATIAATAFGSKTPVDLRFDRYGNPSTSMPVSAWAYVAVYDSESEAQEVRRTATAELDKCSQAMREFEYSGNIFVMGEKSQSPIFTSARYTGMHTQVDYIPLQHCHAIFGNVLNTVIGVRTCSTVAESDSADKLLGLMVDRIYS